MFGLDELLKILINTELCVCVCVLHCPTKAIMCFTVPDHLELAEYG